MPDTLTSAPNLSGLFGQEAAVGALRRALAHESLVGTYLLVGQAGSGKGAVARAFAKAAACRNPLQEPFDACGVCDSCRRFYLGTQPEIVTISPAGDSTQIWQFWTRDNKPPGTLSLTLNYAPLIGKRRVYLIERADTLTESAANSLLKVLEEPPPYALFLLLATHPARVLPTIVSRSQTILIRVARRNELARFLEQTRQLPSAQAALIADYSGGLIGEAVTMVENAALREEIAKILDFAETLPAAAACSRPQTGGTVAKTRDANESTGGIGTENRRGRETGCGSRRRGNRQRTRRTRTDDRCLSDFNPLLSRFARACRRRSLTVRTANHSSRPP